MNDPFIHFKTWYDERVRTFKGDPTSMALATGGSVRMVLLKGWSIEGFVFFTNYRSKKAQQIEADPYGSLLFYWPELKKQIRIEGRIKKITPKESDEYFQTRPYISKLGAHASKQSSPMDNYRTLIRDVVKLIIKHPTYVPLPENWGGYRLEPGIFEFWSAGSFRLHKRISYIWEPSSGEWQKSLLYP
jgi:pyridoxamine 5'-phosphate oxidase